MKHLTLFELADPNNENVDAVMSEAMFLPVSTKVGDLVNYDEGMQCQVLQTYSYQCEADFSLTLAIVYPPELQAPQKADWWCNSTKKMEALAGRHYYQTRHIWISERTKRMVNVYPVYDWDNDLEPKSEGDWQIKTCHTFTCDESPINAIYVAMCEKRVLVAA